MAQKTFNNLSEAFKHLDKQAKRVLQQDDTNVKNVVVRELQESIEENVYAPYDSPAANPYQRLGHTGGLTDPDNFAVQSTSEGVAIYSTRSGQDRNGENVYVAEIIEGNHPYSVRDIWGYGYEEPRHFIEPVRESLRGSQRLTKAFELDMKNAGFKVK